MCGPLRLVGALRLAAVSALLVLPSAARSAAIVESAYSRVAHSGSVNTDGNGNSNCSACRISRPYQPVSGSGGADGSATADDSEPQPSEGTGRAYSSYRAPYYAEDRYHVGAAGKLIDGKIIVGGRGGSNGGGGGGGGGGGTINTAAAGDGGGGAASTGYQYFPPYTDASPGFALGTSDTASSQQVSYDSAKDSYQADADMYGMAAAGGDSGGDMMGGAQMDDMSAGGGYDYTPPKKPFGLGEQTSSNSMTTDDSNKGGDQQYRGPVYPYQHYPESYPEEYSYYPHHGDGGDEPVDSYMPPQKMNGKKKPSTPPLAQPPPPEYLPPFVPKKKPPPYGGHSDEEDDSYAPYPSHGGDDDGGGDDDMEDGGDQHHKPPARPPPPDMGHHGYYLPPPPDHHGHDEEPEEPPEYEDHHMKDEEEEDSRVNKRPYSYYGIGQKLWYIPLYFSVYFILYVTALIIKSVARHKIRYPLTHSWNKRSVAEAAGVALVHSVQTALRDAASKYE